jgi:hypothetical protein
VTATDLGDHQLIGQDLFYVTPARPTTASLFEHSGLCGPRALALSIAQQNAAHIKCGAWRGSCTSNLPTPNALWSSRESCEIGRIGLTATRSEQFVAF